jgi:tetratricopeptide (TPR) repeat protein
VLSHLADRVSSESERGIDPIVTVSLARALRELRQFIPGLDTPPDPHAARFFAGGSRSALESGLYHDALARALRGLSFAPHDPQLHYLAACSCFELGSTREAIDLLLHALWIHPGHPEARRDLESLSAYHALPAPQRDPSVAEGDGLDSWEEVEDRTLGSDFELVDDDPGVPLDDFLSALEWEELPTDEDEPESDDSRGREAA